MLAGILLGMVHGLVSARREAATATIVATVLGRASQGIINGILAAYATRRGAPPWQAALWGALIGAGLGCLSGIPGRAWPETIPLGGLVGLGCGVAASLAARGRA